MDLVSIAFALYLVVLATVFVFQIRVRDKYLILEFAAHAVIITLLSHKFKLEQNFLDVSYLSDPRVFFSCIFASFLLGLTVGRSYAANQQTSPLPTADISPQPVVSAQKFKLKSKQPTKKDGKAQDAPELGLGLGATSLDETENNYSQDVNDKEWKSTFETAKKVVQSISELNTSQNNSYSSKLWSLVQSGPQSHVWTQSSSNGILFRASAVFKCDTATLLRCLNEIRFRTAFEGIINRTDVVENRSIDGQELSIQRYICKARSLTSSHRDFLVVSGSCILENGSVLFASRSLSNDFNTDSTKAKPVKDANNKSHIRGLVHGSGFVVRPMKSNDGSISSGLSISVHIDMCGSSASSCKQWNSIKSQVLLSYLTDAIQKLQAMCESGKTSTNNSDVRTEASNLVVPKSPRDIKNSDTYTSNDLIQLDQGQRQQLFSVLKSAMFRLRSLHKPFYQRLQEDNNVSGIANNEVRGWETICDSNGIIVREQITDSTSPMGVLSAFSSFEEPPHVIKRVLQNQIDDIDGLLEAKAVLCHLSPQTFVQWLAYRSIWPIGARDFLLITSSESFDKVSGEGFVLVSSSIDHICEVDMEDDDQIAQSTNEYTRTLLRLAGYVGVPNAKGGTDLHLFVDVDVYSYIPGWLIQILAQYGLSEIMNRIRNASLGLNITSPTQSRTNSISGNVGPQLEFNKMLSIIQSREEKLQRLIDPGSLPGSPTMPSFMQSPGFINRVTSGSFDEGKTLSLSLSSSNDASNNLGNTMNITTTNSANSTITSSSNNNNTEQVLPAWVEGLSLRTGPFCSDAQGLASDAIKYIQVYFGILESNDMIFDWQLKATKKATNIWTSPIRSSSWQAIKGTTIIPCGRLDLMKLLLDDNRIGEYDDMFDCCQFVSSVNEFTAIRRMMFKAIWPTSPRDFIACTTWKCLSDGSVLIATRSAPDTFYPQEKGFVRGTIHISGYWIQPSESLNDPSVPPGHCRLSLTAHTDLGGTLPVTVINMLSSAAPLKLLGTVGDIVAK